ncbi:hypothetical protein [Actinopolymorpha pittospori]
MNAPVRHAVHHGLERGWIEFQLAMTNRQEVSWTLVTAMVPIAVLLGMRNTPVPGYDLPVATFAVPGVIGMLVAFVAVMGVMYTIAAEREDGTLLRYRAVPFGMVGYLTGQVLRSTWTSCSVSCSYWCLGCSCSKG